MYRADTYFKLDFAMVCGTFVECAELFLGVVVDVEVHIPSDVIGSVLIGDADILAMFLQNVALSLVVFFHAKQN